MKHKSLRLVLVIVGSMMVVPTVQAQLGQSCDTTIADGARLFRSGMSRVETAAKQLEGAGADVRVRTFQTLAPYGNLDQFKDAALRDCRSWQTSDGGMKNNLVVLMVALKERIDGLYFGDQWRPALDREWPRIRSEKIVPRFRDGDFAGGIAAGLDEVTRLIKPAPPREPTDLSGLWTFLRFALGLTFLVLAVLFGSRALSGWNRERSRRQAAQQEAQQAKNAVEALIGDLWDPTLLALLKGKIDKIAAEVVEEEAKPLQTALTKIQKEFDAAILEYGSFDHPAYDPFRNGLSVDAYGNMTEAYREMGTKLTRIGSAIKQLERDVDTISSTIETSGPAIVQAAQAITAVEKEITKISDQGFRTESVHPILQRARTSLSEAQVALKAKRFKVVIEISQHAVEQARSAAQAANLLPQKKIEIEGAIGKLSERIPSVIEKVKAGRALFEQISATYAPSSWRIIRGNGTEAENRIDWATDALKMATKAATMQEQEWQVGLDLIAQANKQLDEAESFMRSITALKENLQVAQRDAPAEIEAAATDIQSAWRYIKEHDSDIRESLEGDLHRAEKDLNEARTELNDEKPDYIKVLKLATSANKTADKVMREAGEEHEAAERLRKKAVSALRDAERSVSAAKEYIEDHTSDVERDAELLIAAAQELLSNATAARNLEARVRYAEQAEAKAEQALNDAKEDVEEEEDRRSRVSTTYVGWGSSRSSSSSYDGGSSWGSSGSSGSGSIGSGGSGGWGGSSSGGGGSGSGW